MTAKTRSTERTESSGTSMPSATVGALVFGSPKDVSAKAATCEKGFSARADHRIRKLLKTKSLELGSKLAIQLVHRLDQCRNH